MTIMMLKRVTVKGINEHSLRSGLYKSKILYFTKNEK